MTETTTVTGWRGITTACLLAVCGLGGLQTGLYWQRWCQSAGRPSLAVLPLGLFIACVAWLFLTRIRLLQPLLDTSGRRPVQRVIHAVLFGVLGYLLAVLSGSQSSFGRWVLVVLWGAGCSCACLLASRALSAVVFSQLLTRRAKLRLLASLFGCLFCVSAVAVMEFISGFLLDQQTPGPSKVEKGTYLEPGEFFQLDASLGNSMLPSREVTSSLVIDGEATWNVRYTTDRFGRRTTIPAAAQSTATSTAMFFGCSYLFGEGSDDHQTIPSVFNTLVPGFTAVNYGMPGWGTQHMLALLEGGELHGQVETPVKLGIYLYLPDVHEPRVVGDMDIVNGFGKHFPYYRLDTEGIPVRQGTMTSGRPVTAWFYWLMGKSQTRALLGLNFPRRKPEHYLLTAAIIQRSRDLFLQQFPQARFLVVGFPDPDPETLTLRTIRDNGIEVLNLAGLFDPADPEMQHVGDGHPTPEANILVAEAIAKYLQSGVPVVDE